MDELRSKYGAKTKTLSCPGCGKEVEMPAFDVVDVTRHPELREKVLTREIFTLSCPHCGYRAFVSYPMLYRDDELRLAVEVCPSKQAAAEFVFSRDLSAGGAPAQSRTLRTVVGTGGLVEKIRVFEAGRNELAVAYLKKRILERKKGSESAFFDGIRDGLLCFVVTGRDGASDTVKISEEDYKRVLEYVNASGLKDRLTSHLVDTNVFEQESGEDRSTGTRAADAGKSPVATTADKARRTNGRIGENRAPAPHPPPPVPDAKPKAAAPPALDEKRIAKDENDIGVRFSPDKRTLVEYPAYRRFMEYTVPAGVIAIGNGAFRYSKLRHIVIPEGVISIGDEAFAHCGNLARVYIPGCVISIGDGAFDDCASLTEVVIPPGVTHIGKRAFRGCESLTEVVIPAGVTHIGDGAFYDCASLTRVDIPDSVTHIGDGAFSDCASLTRVDIPDSVTHIGDGAFSDCASLTEVVIPTGVTHIGEWAFRGCASLTRVVIPDGVTHIGDFAFLECFGLTAVTIPESVTSIGSEAFRGCSYLDVYVPKGVTFIGADAFRGCKSLKRENRPGIGCLASIFFFLMVGFAAAAKCWFADSRIVSSLLGLVRGG